MTIGYDICGQSGFKIDELVILLTIANSFVQTAIVWQPLHACIGLNACMHSQNIIHEYGRCPKSNVFPRKNVI